MKIALTKHSFDLVSVRIGHYYHIRWKLIIRNLYNFPTITYLLFEMSQNCFKENFREFLLSIVTQVWNELNLRSQLFPIILYINPQKITGDTRIDFKYTYILFFYKQPFYQQLAFWMLFGNPLSANPTKWFECVWPFCGVGVQLLGVIILQ